MAAFDHVDLGSFRSEHRLTQTWLALHRLASVEIEQPLSGEESIGVFLQISAPTTASAGVKPELVKGLFDGVVSAFQNHPDMSNASAIADRLHKPVDVAAEEIETYLRHTERALFWSTQPLVRLSPTGRATWNPADHRLVAGEVVWSNPATARPLATQGGGRRTAGPRRSMSFGLAGYRINLRHSSEDKCGP